MSPKRTPPTPPPEPHVFRDPEEIDRAIVKLQRRIQELSKLDVRKAIIEESGDDGVIRSNIRDTIREVFGSGSPECDEHQYIQIWAGPMATNMHPDDIVERTERGKAQVGRVLQGLVARLQEKREDFGGASSEPTSYFRKLNLHPRIAGVANDLFMDGHPWPAVFEAAKALVNLVKERSGRHDLDGAPLVRTVFSPQKPILAFNELGDVTDRDEQEGMMHLFEGAVQAIRNPGGHTFPEGSAQRALEYISFLSLLAYRAQEARRVRVEPVP